MRPPINSRRSTELVRFLAAAQPRRRAFHSTPSALRFKLPSYRLPYTLDVDAVAASLQRTPTGTLEDRGAQRRREKAKLAFPAWVQSLLPAFLRDGTVKVDADAHWARVDPARGAIFVVSESADVTVTLAPGTATVSSTFPLRMVARGGCLLLADEGALPDRFWRGERPEAGAQPPQAQGSALTEPSAPPPIAVSGEDHGLVGGTFLLPLPLDRVEVWGSASLRLLTAPPTSDPSAAHRTSSRGSGDAADGTPAAPRAFSNDVTVVVGGCGEVVLPAASTFESLHVEAARNADVSGEGITLRSLEVRVGDDATVSLPGAEADNISADVGGRGKLSGLRVLLGGRVAVKDSGAVNIAASKGAAITTEGGAPG